MEVVVVESVMRGVVMNMGSVGMVMRGVGMVMESAAVVTFPIPPE